MQMPSDRRPAPTAHIIYHPQEFLHLLQTRWGREVANRRALRGVLHPTPAAHVLSQHLGKGTTKLCLDCLEAKTEGTSAPSQLLKTAHMIQHLGRCGRKLPRKMLTKQLPELLRRNFVTQNLLRILLHDQSINGDLGLGTHRRRGLGSTSHGAVRCRSVALLGTAAPGDTHPLGDPHVLDRGVNQNNLPCRHRVAPNTLCSRND